jgi:gliding motility-associated lipoprotein GldB
MNVMILKRAKILPFVAILFIIISCQQSDSVDVSKIPINVKIYRMEQEIFSCKTKEDIQQLLESNKNIVHQFYQASSADTSLINRIYYISHFPALDSLYQQTQATFGNLEDLTKQFEAAFRHIKYYYPDFKAPKIVTTFSALDKDLFVSDSLVVISLENFIGKKAKYRPQISPQTPMPAYILRRYEANYIVPTVIKFLSNKYNRTDANDQSMMTDMVFYGKALEFTKMMMPQTADSLIIAYSDEQLTNTWNAQDLVYAHFIDQKLLYETNARIKEKYLGERPITNEIGKDCPGRIGQWLGWRIVSRYRTENTAVSLQDLMKNTNARQIFEASKYKGQIDKE